jgi:hypothetical protein
MSLPSQDAIRGVCGAFVKLSLRKLICLTPSYLLRYRFSVSTHSRRCLVGIRRIKWFICYQNAKLGTHGLPASAHCLADNDCSGSLAHRSALLIYVLKAMYSDLQLSFRGLSTSRLGSSHKFPKSLTFPLRKSQHRQNSPSSNKLLNVEGLKVTSLLK